MVKFAVFQGAFEQFLVVLPGTPPAPASLFAPRGVDPTVLCIWSSIRLATQERAARYLGSHCLEDCAARADLLSLLPPHCEPHHYRATARTIPLLRYHRTILCNSAQESDSVNAPIPRTP